MLGHVKRLLQGIGELTELIKSGPAFPSVATVPGGVEPPTPIAHTGPSNLPPIAVEDPILPPPQSWISGSPDKVDFGRMKELIETRIGVNRVLPGDSEEQTTAAAHTSPFHFAVSSDMPPQLPPKKKHSPSHEAFGKRAARGTEIVDS